MHQIKLQSPNLRAPRCKCGSHNAMREPTRLVAVALIPLLIGACSDKAVKGAEPPPRPVITFRIANSDLVAGRAFPGQARSAHEAALSFRVGGRMLERLVKTGDQVKQGDVVATLDPAPYQAEVDSVSATLERARAAYRNAASQLDRDRQLFEKDIVAKARLETSDANAQQTLSEMRSLEATLERRKLDLGYTVLRAPFGGVVSAVFAEAFEEVKPQQSVLRIIDPEKIEMTINVPESLISLVPYAVDIKVTFDAFPGLAIPAEISEIGKEPSETTRTYAVKLLVAPPSGVTIVPGMAGRATARPGPEIAERFKGVVVPLSAILSPDDVAGSFVWIVNDASRTVSRQKIELGEPVTGGINVKDGLKPGDLIVVAGVHSLQEGQAVRIQGR
jgi:RND family efflux transporter MFP subunit